MRKTLILIFHPDLSRSNANAMLAAAASSLPDTEILDMQALYPDGRIDADVETARLLAAERIVLQFPVQWYSTPPLLKAWQDAVLTRMFYIRYDSEGRQIEGTPLLVAATAGNVPEAYAPDGANLFPLAELMKPLRATANRCSLPWFEPFFVYRADKLDGLALDHVGRRYIRHLNAWRNTMPSHREEAQTSALCLPAARS